MPVSKFRLERVRSRGFLAAGTLAASLLGPAALAAPPAIAIPSADDSADSTQVRVSGPFGFMSNLERSNYMLGDMWGLRPLLARYGLTFAVQETSEVLGNVSGGTRRGLDYDGLTQMVLQMDTQRAFGWHGGTFNVSALQIHGRNLSSDDLSSLQTASGIESDRSTRLWELWYQQKFLDEDRLDIKIGQQSLDQEFMGSQNAAYFVNTMFGWPMLPSADLPGGGPAYPLSALGVRLRARPTDSVTVLAGVFNGTPAARFNTGDPQISDGSGTNFPLNGGALVIAEVQFAYPSLGTLVSPDSGEPLGRLYKLGFWYDTERFADQRYDNTGLSLADPSSNGAPQTHHGNYAIYAVVDQMIWRSPEDPDRNINIFFRPMGTPVPNRNLISFSANLGLTMHEPFLNRDDDTFGLALGYARVSSRASGLDRDNGFFNGGYAPARGSEMIVEATYQYAVAPWMQLQPDFQYVFHPGGGIADPNNANRRIKNETVLGLRTNILF